MSANVHWAEALTQLDRLENDCKSEGWDSYGGHPLTPECLATARLLADRACIVPMSSGGICFTFGPDENVLFTVDSHGRISEVNFSQVPAGLPESGEETPWSDQQERGLCAGCGERIHKVNAMRWRDANESALCLAREATSVWHELMRPEINEGMETGKDYER